MRILSQLVLKPMNVKAAPLNGSVLVLLLGFSLECFLAKGFTVKQEHYSYYAQVRQEDSSNQIVCRSRSRCGGGGGRFNGAQQQLYATKNDPETWSRSSTGLSSPFGLRKRVRAVLKKAKDRTGIANYNTETTTTTPKSPASVVAETASIGGFESNDANLDFESSLLKASLRTNLDWLQQNKSEADGLISLPSIALDESSTGSTVDALLNTEQTLEPLPFTLPTLTQEQEQLLRSGQRVQEQSKMGREGSGFVVMDVKAPPDVVWECLLDFEAYPENIGTVKRMTMFTNTHLTSSYIAESPVPLGSGREKRHYGTPSITRASFVLSKFHLNIAAIHKYQPHPDGHYMVFTLDRACKNLVMQDAKGIWYTQPLPPTSTAEGGTTSVEETTRVWLLCEVKVSSLLPSFIVDYAAKRAMPRATTWLPPLAERVAKQQQ